LSLFCGSEPVIATLMMHGVVMTSSVESLVMPGLVGGLREDRIEGQSRFADPGILMPKIRLNGPTGQLAEPDSSGSWAPVQSGHRFWRLSVLETAHAVARWAAQWRGADSSRGNNPNEFR